MNWHTLQAGAVAATVLVTSSACRDLDRFDTADGEAYCGSLVSAPFAHDGLVPDHAPPSLSMRLRLDVDHLSSVPGALSTDDAERGLCTPAALFDETPLRAIEQAFHDPLSQLQFGEANEHNLLCWVDSSCLGTMVAVVSLMKNDDVEVRLLKPAPLPAEDAGAAERPGFAQFRLRRHEDDCGF